MTTSLGQQLQKLAVPQTSLLERRKKRASLLFDPKEAAEIDRDTFFDIGISGLKELQSYNIDFIFFENSLFSPASKQIERAIQTEDVNVKLNKNIKKFLASLSPYFLLKPAHKALEWLIHRFSIHEYNIDECMWLMLPYHETNIFVRFLQILNIRNEQSKWNWLRPFQKNGVHLTKLVLFNHAVSNVGFLKFINDMTLQNVKEHSSNSNALTTMFNFFCTCVIGTLEHTTDVTEPQISAILPTLLRGYSSKMPDFVASTYMITYQLLKKCKLSHKILSQIVSKLLYGNQTVLQNEATLLIILLYQSQSESYSILSDKAYKNLVDNKWFVGCLAKIADNGTYIFPLVLPLFKALLKHIQEEKSQTFFYRLLMEVNFDDNTLEEIISCILTSLPEVSSIEKQTMEWCGNLLKYLERRHPDAFDKILQKILSTKMDHSTLTTFLNYGMSVSHKGDSVDVFGKLYHPNSEFRANAITFLNDNYPALNHKEISAFRNVIKNTLLDDEKDVILSFLSLNKAYIFELLGDDIISFLTRLLYICKKNSWSDVSLKVLPLLCDTGSGDSTEIFLAVLPYLLPTNDDQLLLSLHLLQTNFAKEYPVLRRMNKKVPKEITPESFSQSIYSVICEERTLPELNILIKAIEKINRNKVIDKYLWIVLTVSALKQHSSSEEKIKVLNRIISYIKPHKILPLQKSVTFPFSNGCIDAANQGNVPLQGILLCITILIEKTLKTNLSNQWLDLSKAETRFPVEVFNFLVNGCNTNANAAHYAKTLKTFFDKFLETFKNKIEFLANVILTSEDVETQLRSCKVLNSLIAKSTDSLQWALDFDSKILVPFILISLSNPTYEIRVVAIDILNNVANSVCLKQVNTYKPLLLELVKRKEEMLLDSEQLPLILFSVLHETSNFTSVSKSLIQITCEESTPVQISASLLKILTFINSPQIFVETSKLTNRLLKTIQNDEKLLDIHRSGILYNVILRFNETVTGSIELNSPVWCMLSHLLKLDIVTLIYAKNKIACPSILFLQQINRENFSKLNFEVRRDLIDLFARLVTEAENPEIASAVNRVVKSIDLDAKLVVDKLTAMRDVKSSKVLENPRKAKRTSTIPTVDILESKEWVQGVAILEFIQDKKKMTNCGLLLPVLFGVLKKSLDFDEQAPLEYTKQLLLTSILHCCAKMEEDVQKIPESHFNMELVVQCVRASQNPQTHHHALLVLAHTASFIPNQVLLNIMSIFTFVGSSVLRHDDSYSFQIISQIIETIIPILITAETDTESKVAGVLRVFVDAILDVPEHRRMPLFTKLLQTLGITEYLWLFLLLVFEAHVVHGNEKTNQKTNKLLTANNPQRLSIVTDITLEYTPDIIMGTCIKLLEYLKALPQEKDDRKQSESSSINFDNYTAKQFRHYKYTIVTFLSGLLQAKPLVNSIAVMNRKETLAMEALYKDMIISILTYLQRISSIADKSVGTPQAQYWKVMLHHCYDILDSINALLTKEMFLLVIRGLVVHNFLTVRRKALELLNTKLHQESSFFYSNPKDDDITETDDLFALLPSLIDIIKTIKKDNVEPEQELIQQTALLTVKLLIKLLAEKNPDKFVSLIEFVTDLIKSEKAQGNILASVVLCLAELITYLRAHAISSLVKFMPAIIKVLKTQKHQDAPNLLLMCTVTAVQKIVESLPLFLSPYLEKLLYELSVLYSTWETEDSKSAFNTKLKGILVNIGNTIPPRILIPTIGQTYNKLLRSSHYKSIGALMMVLSENFTNIQGQELSALIPELTKFFLAALQFRSENNSDSNVNLVEDYIIEAFSSLVLKLSETTFRPLFYRLYDWAVRSDTKNERVITFYRLSAGMASSLKGLFVLFAGHFVKHAASILDECNTYKTKELYFAEEKKCIILLESVLLTLKTIFMHDSQSFVDKDRFESLMQPLVDQLENKLGGVDALSERANELVIPCIAQFAVSTADDSLWKQLNYQVLLKTRHDLPSVRLLGLQCLAAVTNKIGEDFLPLLPETIPFLAELLEDENEIVETSCQKVVQNMEKVLGESLQKYF